MKNMINLHESFLFEGVDEQYVDKFLQDCERIHLKKDEFLFHKDEIGDSMYVVEAGQLEILLDEKNPNKSLHTMNIPFIESGTIIGELCVFGQQKRSASIRALKDSTLLKIEGEDFRIRIYSRELDALLICYNIARILSQRLISMDILFIRNNLS